MSTPTRILGFLTGLQALAWGVGVLIAAVTWGNGWAEDWPNGAQAALLIGLATTSASVAKPLLTELAVLYRWSTNKGPWNEFRAPPVPALNDEFSNSARNEIEVLMWRDKLSEMERQRDRSEGLAIVARAGEGRAKEELAALRAELPAPIIPEPPDKDLVKVFRSYGVPAFEAVYGIWKATVQELGRSKDVNSWKDWVSKLLEDNELPKVWNSAAAAKNSAKGEGGPFTEAFVAFCWSYSQVIVWLTWMTTKEPGLVTDAVLSEWLVADADFAKSLLAHTLADETVEYATSTVRQNIETQRKQLEAVVTRQSELRKEESQPIEGRA